MHRIAVPVTAGLPMFELAIPCEVFEPGREDFPVPWWYELQLCAVQDGPVRTAEGLLFDSSLGLDELSQADTVIIPGCADRQDDAPEALLQALRTAYDRGARIASICTGAFILAAAGLLDGRTVTTHWMHAGELTRRWPAVRVEPNVLYTDDGQILTSAGSAAGLDLCLHIVCNDHGTRIANTLARRLVMPPHREGGQAQYIEQPLPATGAQGLGSALDWAREDLALPLPLEDPSHLRPALPRDDRHHTAAMAVRRASPPRARTAREHRRHHRAHRNPVRLRIRTPDAYALHPDQPRDPVRIPANLPAARRSLSPPQRVTRRTFLATALGKLGPDLIGFRGAELGVEGESLL